MKTEVFLFQLSYSDLPKSIAFQRGHMVILPRFKTMANELHITITAYLPLP